MTSSLVLLVHGHWGSPAQWDQVSSNLKARNINVRTSPLISTGTVSPGNPTMHDDIEALRKHITELVETKHEIVLVLHSGSGFLGCNAMKGLSRSARIAKALRGGVSRIVFVAAGIFPEGFKHKPLPFAEVKGGALVCKDPKRTLFNDLSAADAEKWTKAMRPQPAHGWDGTVTYCGWREVPSEYVICKRDNALSVQLQEQMADMAGCRVHELDSGHIPMLSQPGAVADIVARAVQRTRPRASL